jgi:1,4-dihydroxy-2-naphthoate octaprenyltransferase
MGSSQRLHFIFFPTLLVAKLPAPMNYVNAIRPWSLTSSAMAVVIATAACGQKFFASDSFVRVLLLGMCMQAGGNCTNTYFDFHRGVDNKNSGEKTLVDAVIPPMHILLMSNVFYVLSALAAWPYLQPLASCSSDEPCYHVRILFGLGVALAYAYSASPFSLKYRALGGVVVYACFGPLLMQLTSIILTGSVRDVFYIYSIPTGSLAWAMYHANDSRDINSDTQAGVTTLASLVGYNISSHIFTFLVITAFVASFMLGTFFHAGCLLVFLATPIVQNLLLLSQQGKLEKLPEEVQKVLLLVGSLLAVGIVLSPNESFVQLTIRLEMAKIAEQFLNMLPPGVQTALTKYGGIGLGYFGIH